MESARTIERDDFASQLFVPLCFLPVGQTKDKNQISVTPRGDIHLNSSRFCASQAASLHEAVEQNIKMHYTSIVPAGLSLLPLGALSPRRLTDLPQDALEKAESTLVAEAKAGSSEAFEELVNRYDKKIYRLALRLTGNEQDAEDVLQESFLKAFEHLPEFRQDSRFYTWLVRIAVNEGLMKLRKRRSDKSEPLENTTDEDGQVMPRDFRDWKPNPEQLMGQEEMEQILMKAAQTLSPSLRTVFLLRDVDELSTEETAKTLGLTTGAVKARLFRARMQLREELSKVLKRE